MQQMWHSTDFQSVISLADYFPHLHTLPVLSSVSSPTSPISHFIPPLLSTKEVNEKLSYRGQNALSVVNRRTQYRQRVSVCQSRLAGRMCWMCWLTGTLNVLELSDGMESSQVYFNMLCGVRQGGVLSSQLPVFHFQSTSNFQLASSQLITKSSRHTVKSSQSTRHNAITYIMASSLGCFDQ